MEPKYTGALAHTKSTYLWRQLEILVKYIAYAEVNGLLASDQFSLPFAYQARKEVQDELATRN